MKDFSQLALRTGWIVAAALFWCEVSMANATESPSMAFQQILSGGVINNRDVALEVARAIIKSLYGMDELAKQEPLYTSETKDEWIVYGSFNKDRREEGLGQISINIKKRDAQIVDIKWDVVVFTPRDIQEIINRNSKNRQ